MLALIDGGFEPAAYAAGAVVVWAAVLAGLVARIMPTRVIATPALWGGGLLGASAVLAAASIAWAGNAGGAFEVSVRIAAYFGVFTLAACTAAAADRDRWLTGLAAGLAVVSLIAVISRLQPGLLGESGFEAVLPGAQSRLSYPVGYWNALAALLAIAIVLLCWCGQVLSDRRLRIAAIALVPVPMLGIYYTSSRGAVIALALGLLALLIATPARSRQAFAIAIGCAGGAALVVVAGEMREIANAIDSATARHQGDVVTLLMLGAIALTGLIAAFADRRQPDLRLRPSLRAWIAIGAVAVVGLGAVAVASHPAQRFNQFKQAPPELAPRHFEATGLGDTSGSGRWQLWSVAVDAFETHPVRGIGAGGYEAWWARHANINLFVRDAHSLPLQDLAELGLLGIVLLFGFCAAVLAAAIRHLRAGCESGTAALIGVLAVGAVSAAIDWSWAIPATFAPVVVAAGLLTASAPGVRRGAERFALGIATVAFAWVAMVSAGIVLLTEVKLDQSRREARSGEIDAAIDSARDARRVQPWSAQPDTQLALLEEARGDYDAAIGYLNDAIDRDSEDWRLALIDARLQVKRGDVSEGNKALDRARALNPRSPIFQSRAP